MTINQITSLVKALNAVVKGSVLVKIAVVNPRKAQAPTGRGDKTSPAMVERKIESNCQACIVTSTGFGIANRTIIPIATEITKGSNLAP